MSETIPTLEELRQNGKRVLSRALGAIEQAGDSAEIAALLDSALGNPRAFVIGFTGPPGVGKSTLINALIERWRKEDVSVGVIAVDPSSRATGGALLGDRTRMTTDPEDDGTFVRSLASRGKLGGLTELAFPAMTIMRAIYDRVIVETVGVGQSEADISTLADTVVLCVQPGSGDSLQFMKAGIMEIPDIAIVTKADFGKSADRAVGELQGALSLTAAAPGSWKIPVHAVSSTSGAGIVELLAEIEKHLQWLNAEGLLLKKRRSQSEYWLEQALAARYGSEGLKAAKELLQDRETSLGPFALERDLRHRMSIKIENC